MHNKTRMRRLLAAVMMGSGPTVRTWYVNDTFTTDRAAGAVHGTAAEPGPGTRTAIENDGQFTIGSSLLAIPAQTTPGAGDLLLKYGAVTRAAGLAMAVQHKMTTSATNGNARGVGFYNNTLATDTAHREHSWFLYTGTVMRFNQAAVEYVHTIDSYLNADVTYGVILRAAGAFYVKDYKLMHVETRGSTETLIPIIPGFAGVYTCDYAKVAQLGGPWITAYGPGALHTSGAIAAETAFAHEANALIYFTITSNGTAGASIVKFRIQDAANYWKLTISNDGSADLSEVVADSATSRATAAAGVFADGERVCISAGGMGGSTHIRILDGAATAMVYTSAANFATATAGEVAALGTDAVLSNLEIYPVDLSGLSLSWLQVFFS